MASKYPLGFKLLKTLEGTGEPIARISWSPDGSLMVGGTWSRRDESYNGGVAIWDIDLGTIKYKYIDFDFPIGDAKFIDQQSLVATGGNKVLYWPAIGNEAHVIEMKGKGDLSYSIQILESNSVLVSRNDKTIQIVSLDSETVTSVYDGRIQLIFNILLTPNKKHLIAAGVHTSLSFPSTEVDEGPSFEIWNLPEWKVQPLIDLPKGLGDLFARIACVIPGNNLVIGMESGNLCSFHLESRTVKKVIEGHRNIISSISISLDGKALASKSQDDTVRLWNVKKWETMAVLHEDHSAAHGFGGIAFHPTNSEILATLDDSGTAIRIWELDYATLFSLPPVAKPVYYTTAKIALVGESGVGKSGLGYRIAEDEFRVTESTHGQQFWVVDTLSLTRADGTVCEAVLWDFAGQPSYRPIHALFLDDVDIVLIVFDGSRPNTLESVSYWLKQTGRARPNCRTILVAARTDVSPVMLTQAELDAFCQAHDITGGYIATSAMNGEGIATLLQDIVAQIDWDAKPATVTTETFKRIKDFVLDLKATDTQTGVLVQADDLRQRLEAAYSDWYFTDSEMMTAVGHLQNHGYVTILRRSSEERVILLAPEVLIKLAASFMIKAQVNERGLGTLDEALALRNDYQFQEVVTLDEDERKTLLSAAIELFLKQHICLREAVDDRTFLIFPSLILERPEQMIPDADLVEDVAYVVENPDENLYATLVVLLGYSSSYRRMSQWRYQAQYETAFGEICSFKQAQDGQEQTTFILAYGSATPDAVRRRFQGLFEEILYRRNVQVMSFPPVYCPEGHHSLDRRTVIQRVQAGKDFVFCPEHGERIPLTGPERSLVSSPETEVIARDRAHSRQRTAFETALVSVKSVVRDAAPTPPPSCFISYAWGNLVQERWVWQLGDNLRHADIDVVLDQLENLAPGSSVPRFVTRIAKSDFVLVVGTPALVEKYANNVSDNGSVVAAELDLVKHRMIGTEAQKTTVLPILLEGETQQSFPPLLHRRVYTDMRDSEGYFAALFDIVLTLWHISFDNPYVRDLREQLRQDNHLRY